MRSGAAFQFIVPSASTLDLPKCVFISKQQAPAHSTEQLGLARIRKGLPCVVHQMVLAHTPIKTISMSCLRQATRINGQLLNSDESTLAQTNEKRNRTILNYYNNYCKHNKKERGKLKKNHLKQGSP